MTLMFQLSMPNNNSWNGRWSGAGKFYAIFKTFSGKNGGARAQELLNHRSFYYNFGDGWGASVAVTQVQRRQQSDGFCGYDWMVDSILAHGKIMNDAQVKDYLALAESSKPDQKLERIES